MHWQKAEFSVSAKHTQAGKHRGRGLFLHPVPASPPREEQTLPKYPARCMCVHRKCFVVRSWGEPQRRLAHDLQAKTNGDPRFPRWEDEVSQGTGLSEDWNFPFLPILNGWEGWLLSGFTFQGFCFPSRRGRWDKSDCLMFACAGGAAGGEPGNQCGVGRMKWDNVC